MKLYLRDYPILIGLYLMLISPLAHAFSSKNETPKVSSAIISSVSSVAPGESFDVAIELTHPGQWNSYYKNPGGISLPLSLEITAPDGYKVSPIQWPVPHIKWLSGVQTYFYKGKVYFTARIAVPDHAKPNDSFSIRSSVSSQICFNGGCLPPSTALAKKTLTILPQSEPDEAGKAIIATAKNQLPKTMSNWSYNAIQTDDALTLNIITTDNLSPITKPVFITNQSVTDTTQKQTLTKNELGYTLHIPLAQDLDGNLNFSGVLAGESGSLRADLPGVLVSLGKEQLTVQTSAPEEDLLDDPFSDSDTEEATAEAPQNLSDPSDAFYYLKYDTHGDLIEMAKMASTSTIHTLSIDQINSDGEVINGKGEVIPKGRWTLDENGDIKSNDGTVLNKKQQTTFARAVLLIFLGGLILNLMPCVFPVLGVKVLGFVQLSGDNPKKIKLHGLAFTLGVIISMWVLAGILLAVRSFSGEAISWGSQMQNPYFVGCMIILLALFALNLFGVFEIGTSLTSVGGNLQQKKGYQGSFFSGMLTTLIATPCGAPFLATAMAYTLQQNDFVAMTLFTIFALGVASPYLVLSFLPQLINKLPRPGNWMVTFKKSMSFLLLATCAFLLMPFIDQTGLGGIKWMLWSLVVFATAAFIYGNWSSPYISALKRWIIGYGLALIVATAGGYLGYQAMMKRPTPENSTIANAANLQQPAVFAQEHGWKPWRPGKVEHSRAQGRIAWVDYTATW